MYIDNKNKAYIEQDIVFEERSTKKYTSFGQQKSAKKRGYKELVFFNLFEKSPKVGQMLVRLHDRNKLYGMAKTPDASAKAELMQTVIDLLNFDLTPAENELITDVLVALMNRAERDLRRALSERLATMSGIPLRLILKMAGDEIFVADPILRKSVDLTDFDLIYLIKAQGEEHWRSIAQRPQISRKVVDLLVDTDDLETALNVVKNKSLCLSATSIRQVFKMAKESDILAKPLLMRDELPEEFIIKLYKHVGVELKQYIKYNFSDVKNIAEAVNGVVDEFLESSLGAYTPTQDMIVQAELLMTQKVLTPATMIENLKCRQIAKFVAQFSVYSSLPVGVVEGMIRQKVAQTMAIACKASLIPKGDFINMFLLTSRVRGVRIIDESDLSRAISYYDKISEEMAKSLLKKYRH